MVFWAKGRERWLSVSVGGRSCFGLVPSHPILLISFQKSASIAIILNGLPSLFVTLLSCFFLVKWPFILLISFLIPRLLFIFMSHTCILFCVFIHICLLFLILLARSNVAINMALGWWCYYTRREKIMGAGRGHTPHLIIISYVA